MAARAHSSAKRWCVITDNKHLTVDYCRRALVDNVKWWPPDQGAETITKAIPCSNREYARIAGYRFIYASSPELSLNLDGMPRKEMAALHSLKHVCPASGIKLAKRRLDPNELVPVDENISVAAGLPCSRERNAAPLIPLNQTFQRTATWCKVALLIQVLTQVKSCDVFVHLDTDHLLLLNSSKGSIPLLHDQPQIQRWLLDDESFAFMPQEIGGPTTIGPLPALRGVLRQNNTQHSDSMMLFKNTERAIKFVSRWWCSVGCDVACPDIGQYLPPCYRTDWPLEQKMLDMLMPTNKDSKNAGVTLSESRNDYNSQEGSYARHYYAKNHPVFHAMARDALHEMHWRTPEKRLDRLRELLWTYKIEPADLSK